MEQKTKQVYLSEKILEELTEMKKTNQGFDELLNEILRGYNRHLLAERIKQARQGNGEWIKL